MRATSYSHATALRGRFWQSQAMTKPDKKPKQQPVRIREPGSLNASGSSSLNVRGTASLNNSGSSSLNAPRQATKPRKK